MSAGGGQELPGREDTVEQVAEVRQGPEVGLYLVLDTVGKGLLWNSVVEAAVSVAATVLQELDVRDVSLAIQESWPAMDQPLQHMPLHPGHIILLPGDSGRLERVSGILGIAMTMTTGNIGYGKWQSQW